MEDATNTMVTQYNTSKTITKLFIQIERGVKIAYAANIPFVNA